MNQTISPAAYRELGWSILEGLGMDTGVVSETKLAELNINSIDKYNKESEHYFCTYSAHSFAMNFGLPVVLTGCCSS